MKIIFFSDIHGNKYALDEFFKDYRIKSADKLVFCGDIFGYYYYQNYILDTFKSTRKLRAILGNHDKMFLDIVDGKLNKDILVPQYGSTYEDIENKISEENIKFLRSLPYMLEFDINGHKVGVFHGSPADPLNGRIYPDTDIKDINNYTRYDYVILGHTHHRMVKKVLKTTIINPGSLGQQRDGKGCSALLFDIDKDKESFNFITIGYDVKKLLKDVDLFDTENTRLKEVLLRKEKY